MKTSYSPSIYFCQNDIISFLNNDKSTSFMNKIKAVSANKECYRGFCQGLSMKFLHHQKSLDSFVNDIGFYIEQAYSKENEKNLSPKVITEKELIRYSLNARKKEPFKSGEKILTEAIEIQTLHFNSVTSHELSKNINPPSNTVPASKFLDELLNICDNKKNQFLSESKKQLEDNIYWSEENITNYANSNIKKNITLLYKKVFSDGIIEDNDNHHQLNDITEYLKKEIETKKDTFDIKDIHLFLNAQLYFNLIKTEEKNTDINTRNNIKITFGEYNNSTEFSIKTLPDFLSKLKETGDDNKYYLISSNEHSMALRTNLHDKHMEYIFFDPNEGIYTFRTIEEFEIFLQNFIKEHSKYSFQKQDDNYCLNITGFERIEQKNEHTGNKSYEKDKINLTKKLIKNKISLKLKKDEDSVITPILFNETNGFLELQFNANEISRRIYSAEPSIEELYFLLKDKNTLLNENNGPYFIDKKRNIYQVTDEKRLSELTTNSNLTQLFGSPIFKSPIP